MFPGVCSITASRGGTWSLAFIYPPWHLYKLCTLPGFSYPHLHVLAFARVAIFPPGLQPSTPFLICDCLLSHQPPGRPALFTRPYPAGNHFTAPVSSRDLQMLQEATSGPPVHMFHSSTSVNMVLWGVKGSSALPPGAQREGSCRFLTHPRVCHTCACAHTHTHMHTCTCTHNQLRAEWRNLSGQGQS